MYFERGVVFYSSLCALAVPGIGDIFILRVDATGCAIAGYVYQRKYDILDNVYVSGISELSICFSANGLECNRA